MDFPGQIKSYFHLWGKQSDLEVFVELIERKIFIHSTILFTLLIYFLQLKVLGEMQALSRFSGFESLYSAYEDVLALSVFIYHVTYLIHCYSSVHK